MHGSVPFRCEKMMGGKFPLPFQPFDLNDFQHLCHFVSGRRKVWKKTGDHPEEKQEGADENVNFF